MLDEFPQVILAQLKLAILESLERENVEVEPGTIVTVSNPALGEAEIVLTEGS
jgi:hypothetical protein